MDNEMKRKFYFAFIISSMFAICFSSKLEQCDIIKNLDFEQCTHRFKFMRNAEMLRGRNASKEVNFECPLKICNTKFSITLIVKKLYGYKLLGSVLKMIDTCCGKCFSYDVTNKISSYVQINKTIKNTSDFILPVFTETSKNRKYGFYYIPVFEAPSAYYFTAKISAQEKVVQFLFSILSTWPLLVICLSLTFVSGFLIWLLEKRKSSEEFPKPFLKGLWEGGWWAFVTMTTVGYGDKVPRSMIGRFFTVLWVLAGMTIFAVLTASLTNQITAIFSDIPVHTITGRRVGGLGNKINVATMVAQHGGFLVEHQYQNTVHGYANMMKSLIEKKIDGFVMSRPNFFFVSKIKRYRKYKHIWKKQKEIGLDRTELNHIRSKPSIGILVKKYVHYIFLKSYFEDNWLQIQTCNQFNVNGNNLKYAPESKEKDFASDAFLLFVYVVVGVILSIFCFGLVYELRRYLENKKAKSLTSCEEDEAAKIMKSS